MVDWYIDESEATGSSIEIPARDPGSPRQRLIHFAFTSTNW